MLLLELMLKVGCPVMVIRNLNPIEGDKKDDYMNDRVPVSIRSLVTGKEQ
jgi:hypothetical protein